MARYLCAVDVGTSSVRVGVMDDLGHLFSSAEHPIIMNRPSADQAEYDSEDTWSAICVATRAAMAQSGASGDDVAGIAFDATCSLVVRDTDGRPVSVSLNGQSRWDTIAWLDHRAMGEAEECTDTGHRALDCMSGVMSPEMQLPKLMWLKRHLPQSWARVGHVFDLADFLAWKASGGDARSQCTLTTKWSYLAHEEPGWQPDFLAAVGLDDLLTRGALPARAVPPGSDLGPLTETAARDLGLSVRCRVGAGFVDAYAGALCMLGPYGPTPAEFERRVALIAGTSSCIMTFSGKPIVFRGGWGPHFGTVLPGCWTSEGGQSASGALLDHIIRWHSAGGEPGAALHGRVINRIMELRERDGEAFAARLHVLPDFHGNRTPLADPHALGVISGLNMDSSFDGLCALYWRVSVALALGIRHVLDALRQEGHMVETLHVTGGHTKNRLLMELYADATGCELVTAEDGNAMLLGTAMAAACAGGSYPTLVDAAVAMQPRTRRRSPDPAMARRYAADYQVFLAMHEQRRELDRLIEPRPAGAIGQGRFAGKRLVIFDCDGVLVDSELIAVGVLMEYLRDSDVTVDRATLITEVLGRNNAYVLALLRDRYGIDVDATVERRLQERLFARFRAELKPMPGVHRLLDRLNVPYCLASSSAVRRINAALAFAGLADRFIGKVFSASMVSRGKPAPDLFLHVAKVMGVEPRDCLVIEDSPAGVEAARRANMAVIGFVGGSHADSLSLRATLTALGPDAICSGFDEVLDLVAG